MENIEDIDATSQNQKKFLGSLRDLLLQEVSQGFFQELLDSVLANFPNAQAGSMMVLRAGRYHYIATYGYNLQELQTVTLSLEEAMVLAEPFRPALILNDFQGYNKLLLDDERQELLETFGRVSEIKETLFVPVRQQEEIVTMLFLDNFETVNAFTQEEMTLAEEIGLYLGLAAKLWNYEKRLSVYEQITAVGEQNAIAVTELQTQKKNRSREGVAADLCPREKDVLLQLAKGITNKEIANELGISDITVRGYLAEIYQKLGVHSRKKARQWVEDYKHSLM